MRRLLILPILVLIVIAGVDDILEPCHTSFESAYYCSGYRFLSHYICIIYYASVIDVLSTVAAMV